MADTKGQCAPGKHCVNVERVSGEVSAMRVKSAAEWGFLREKIEDLRKALNIVKDYVDDRVAREHERTGDRLEDGSTHFDELFERMGKVEKGVSRIDRRMLVMWILVLLVGLGELGRTWLFLSPYLGKLIP